MAQTIQTIRKEVYKLLNEATNSTVGALSTGLGTVASGDDSDSNINKFIMEGVADLCRSCVAIPANGTIAYGTNIRTKQLTDISITSPAAGQLWFPTDVYRDGTRLTHASESSIRSHDLGYAANITAATTNVTHWYRHDNYAISLYPYCSTALTITVYGYGMPDTTLSGIPGTDNLKSFSFLPDDILRQALAAYAANKVVMKNVDDPTLAERSFWNNMYNSIRMQLYIQLDSGLKFPGGPFAIPPVQSK
jgi:hypothetical protein